MPQCDYEFTEISLFTISLFTLACNYMYLIYLLQPSHERDLFEEYQQLMRDGGGSMDVDEPKIHPSTTAGLVSHFNFSLLAFTGTKVNFYFPETYTNFSERQKPKSVSSNGTSFSKTIPTRVCTR